MKIKAIVCSSMLLTSSCSGEQGDIDDTISSTSTVSEALDVTQTSSLTKKQGSLSDNNDETSRESDTTLYYQGVNISSNGSSGTQTIANALTTLSTFRNRYSFAGAEQVSFYYNRG